MLPALQISVDTGGVTFLQTVIAVWLVALFIALLLAARYKMAYVGLSDEQSRHRKHLQGQRESATPRSLRLDPADDVDGYRETIRRLFEGSDARDDAGDRLEDDPSLRDAIRAAVGEFRSAWGERTASIPRLTLSLVELAVSITVLGGLATVSAETIRRLVTTDGSISFDYVVDTTAEVVTQIATTAVDVLGAFPFAGTLWNLAFAYSILLGQLLYDHPFGVAAGLVVLAVVVLLLDRRVPQTVNRTIAPRRAQAVLALGIAVGSVWTVGALVATALSHLVADNVAAAAGLVLSALLALLWLIYAAIWTRRRVGTLARTIEGTSSLGATYLLVRRLAVIYGSVAALLVPVYVVALVISGRLAAQLAALSAASLPVKILFGVVALAVVVGVVIIARDTVGDFQTALLNLSARSSVRARLVGRGVPLVTFTFAYFLLVAVGVGAVAAGGGAVVAALATYGIVALLLRAKYRLTVYETPDRRPLSLVIVGYRLRTADGETLYVGRVNTTWYAHPDVDILVEDVVDAASMLAEGGRPAPTESRRHAKDAFRFGIVDIEETRDRIKQDIRTEAKGRLRKKNGMMDAETLEEQLEEYPSSAVERVLRSLRIGGELRRQDGYYYLG